MRILIFILLLSPILSSAQKTDVFIQLADAKGQQIKGDVVTKGFENWLGATTINSAGKTNTLLSFTMTVNGASADLKKAAANGEILVSGQVFVISPNPSGGRPLTSYTIKMESISVLSCYESMGCNNTMNTTVSLQATRIGWTYYNTSAKGAQTVTRKFGWDERNNKEWTSF
jgi:type VI protein secretion system component Hcp